MVARISGCPDIFDVKGNFVVTVRRTGTFLVLYMRIELQPSVQIFNSCSSQTDVCQCFVVQTPMDNLSKNKPSTSRTHVACKYQSYVQLWGHRCIHDQETERQFMPGLPMHLVQDLNIGTLANNPLHMACNHMTIGFSNMAGGGSCMKPPVIFNKSWWSECNIPSLLLYIFNQQA